LLNHLEGILNYCKTTVPLGVAQMRGALPDLIVTDLKMPNMSGFEFLSVVRRRFPHMPTIAISGEFHPPVEPLGVLADAFFSKPHTSRDLFAKVGELLRDAPLLPGIKKDRAPVGVPRNGDYDVITCTDCLRSFSIAAEKDARALRELRTLEYVFCDAQGQFIVEEKPEASGLPILRRERSPGLPRVDGKVHLAGRGIPHQAASQCTLTTVAHKLSIATE
jgi:Response regulator receiver domain